MKIEYPIILSSISTQPTTALISAADIARVEVIITALAAGPFYVKRAASATPASITNFDIYLSGVGSQAIVSNWKGDITISPTPTAGQINVANGLSHL